MICEYAYVGISFSRLAGMAEFNRLWVCKGTYLCANAMRSAALPVPSQTTTGTGGVSVTYSRTARIVLVPPSITRLMIVIRKGQVACFVLES